MADRGVDLAYGRTLPRRLREAGLTAVCADGYFPITGPACLELERATIAQVRGRLLAAGLATDAEIEQHLANLATGLIDAATSPMITAWGRTLIPPRSPTGAAPTRRGTAHRRGVGGRQATDRSPRSLAPDPAVENSCLRTNDVRCTGQRRVPRPGPPDRRAPRTEQGWARSGASPRTAGARPRARGAPGAGRETPASTATTCRSGGRPARASTTAWPSSSSGIPPPSGGGRPRRAPAATRPASSATARRGDRPGTWRGERHHGHSRPCGACAARGHWPCPPVGSPGPRP
jgi:hypothetical protein